MINHLDPKNDFTIVKSFKRRHVCKFVLDSYNYCVRLANIDDIKNYISLLNISEIPLDDLCFKYIKDDIEMSAIYVKQDNKSTIIDKKLYDETIHVIDNNRYIEQLKRLIPIS